jgi:hypothetical protein
LYIVYVDPRGPTCGEEIVEIGGAESPTNLNNFLSTSAIGARKNTASPEEKCRGRPGPYTSFLAMRG